MCLAKTTSTSWPTFFVDQTLTEAFLGLGEREVSRLSISHSPITQCRRVADSWVRRDGRGCKPLHLVYQQEDHGRSLGGGWYLTLLMGQEVQQAACVGCRALMLIMLARVGGLCRCAGSSL